MRSAEMERSARVASIDALRGFDMFLITGCSTLVAGLCSALGLSFGGILAFAPEFRLMSVLGFIGISWGLAATVYLSVKKTWGRIAVLTLLMAVHFCLTHFGVAPDAPDSLSR